MTEISTAQPKRGGANGFGSIYKMTPAGALTILHSFSETDGLGLHPLAGLVQATDGKFYGAAGSNTSSGVLFQITSTGKYRVLLNLTNTTGKYPGANPQVSLFQHTNGTLYGDTYGGGTGKLCFCGVLYSLGMKLGPFVSFVGPLFEGKVGKTIEILGQGFTGDDQGLVPWSLRNLHGGLRHLSDRGGSSRRDDRLCDRNHARWNPNQQQNIPGHARDPEFQPDQWVGGNPSDDYRHQLHGCNQGHVRGSESDHVLG